MLYIDCDGVILNTEIHLFADYPYIGDDDTEERRRKYVSEFDWYKLLRKAGAIGDAVETLKKHYPEEATILTKICSIEEGKCKIDFFRELGIRNNIIIVPIDVHKADVVEAYRSILVDDSINNLTYWQKKGGRALYFGSDQKYDPKFERVKDLKTAFSISRRFVVPADRTFISDRIIPT